MLWLVGFGVICTVSGAALFAFATRHNPVWAIGAPVAAVSVMGLNLFLIFSERPGSRSTPEGSEKNATAVPTPPAPNPQSPPDAVLQPGDVPPWGQPGPVLDLLSGLDPTATQLAGIWTMQNGSLISPIAAPARMYFPVRLPRKYQLTAVVERLQGSDSISLGVTIGGRDVGATIDGFDPKVSGLNLLDRSTPDRNESRRLGPFIRGDGPTTIVCTVGDNSIHVTCDGRVAIDWQGDVSRLDQDGRWPNGPPGFLHLATWNTQFLISKLELRSMP